MRRIVNDLARDEAGFIISAELVMIATVSVLGLVVGLTCLRNAVNDEMKDLSCALTSIDQCFYYTGFRSRKCPDSCETKAWTAGSTNMVMMYGEVEFAPTEVETHVIEPTPVIEETPMQIPAPVIELPAAPVAPAAPVIEGPCPPTVAPEPPMAIAPAPIVTTIGCPVSEVIALPATCPTSCVETAAPTVIHPAVHCEPTVRRPTSVIW